MMKANTKYILLPVLSGLFLRISAGCIQQTYSRAPHIVTKEVTPFYFFLLPPHLPISDGYTVLIVDGKRFAHVRGSPPFFCLKVPHTNAIVFVTEEHITAGEWSTFHFYGLDTKKDIKVEVGMDRGLGLSFGGTNGADRVFSFTGTNICISSDRVGSGWPRTQSRYNIDLSQRRYLSEERLWFDETGAVTNRDFFSRSR